MTERMTSIDLPGVPDSGAADWGRKSPADMIAILRQKAAHDKATAEAIMSASDDDFYVQTYTGVYRQRNHEVLQQGRKS